MGGVTGAEEGAQGRYWHRESGAERVDYLYESYGARELAEYVVEADDDYARMYVAWVSARQRAATEAVHATEALAIRDAEIARLKAALSASRLAEVDPYI